MKHKRLRNGASAVCFLIILAGLLCLTQHVLRYKFKYPADGDDHMGRLQEFYHLEDNTVDALFFGTSHSMYGVLPMEIYKEYGLVTYNLSTSKQTVDVTYHLLEEAFKSQSPKVVFLDASNLFFDDFNNASWRRMLDSEPLSLTKIKSARDYALAYTGKSVSGQPSFQKKVSVFNDKVKAALAAVLPLYYYHNRWNELGVADISSINEATYAKGANMSAGIISPGMDVDGMNAKAEEKSQSVTVYKNAIVDGEEKNEERQQQEYSLTFPEGSTRWVKKLKVLCERNGAELILMKIPSVTDPLSYDSAWTKMRSDRIKELAADAELTYLDLLYDGYLGSEYDISKAFKDGGKHSSFQGAEQISHFFGRYLSDYGLEKKQQSDYENTMAVYDQVTDKIRLASIYDLDTYLSALDVRNEKLSIFMAGNGNSTGWLSEEQRKAMQDVGLQTDWSKVEPGSAFAACLENGNVRYEAFSNGKLDEKVVLRMAGTTIKLKSVGSLSTMTESPSASITVNGAEYAEQRSGLCFVVMDNETGVVVDTAVFWPQEGETLTVNCTRSRTYELSKVYEHACYERVDIAN